MCTSRLVRFCTSLFNLSISEPLRPMMIPGRAVLDSDHQLICRAFHVNPANAADFSFSFSTCEAETSSMQQVVA